MRNHLLRSCLVIAALLCLAPAWRLLAAPTATVVGDGSPASCTAGALAAAVAVGGEITFNCGASPVTIAGGPYTVAGVVAIDGGGLVTLSGENAHRHFVVQADASLRLTDLTLIDGSVADGAGSILSEGAVTLDRVTIRNSRTTGEGTGGGAIASLGGALTILDSQLIGNEAAYTGGALLLSDSVTVIENSLFADNTAQVFGAIDGSGDLTIRNTTLRGNRATAGDGGAVGILQATALIEKSLIEKNFAGGGGGGVYSSPNYPGTTVTIRDTRIIQNEADAAFAGSLGGGILSGAGLTLERVTLAENSAYNAGGLFQYGDEGLLIVRDSLVHNNTAVQSGGGLMLGGALGHTFTNVTISGNSAGDWAGGLYVPDYPATLRHVTLYGNSAPLGANLYTLRTTVTFAGAILGNPLGGGANCADQDTAPPAISDGYNVSSDDSCLLNHASDLSATDPLLGPLADNGGPTLTHLPQPGSPAIDHAPLVGCPAADQRGFVRPAGAACDSGAVEAGASAPTPTATPSPTATTAPPSPTPTATPTPTPRPPDRTPPVVNRFTALGGPDFATPNITLRISASDNPGGAGVSAYYIVEYEWVHNVGWRAVAATPSWRAYTGAHMFVDWSLGSLSPGLKAFEVWAADRAGNVSAPYQIRINFVPPSMMVSQGGWHLFLYWVDAERTFSATSIPTQGDPDIYLCCRNGAWSTWSTFAGTVNDSVTVTTTRGDLYWVGVHGWTTARYGLVTSGAAGQSRSPGRRPAGEPVTPPAPPSDELPPQTLPDPPIGYQLYLPAVTR